MTRIAKLFLSIFLIMVLSGCEGIFDNIYDVAPSDNVFEEGFHPGAKPDEMVLQLNATSYDQWIYIDLHNRQIERRDIPRELTGEWDGKSGITYHLVEGDRYTELSQIPTDVQDESENWDLAIHHFDVKTNGGMVAVAGSEMFTPDEWTDNRVIVDLREMMGFKIGYQRSMVNSVLSAWVTMDISSPPPTFTASGDTYILKMKDGTSAQLRMRSYISERGTKGYLTIDIKYPL